MTTLEDAYQMHAIAGSAKAVSEQQRQTIRERKDTLKIDTPPINISGKMLITIHDDHVQVTFEGREKSFHQTEQFLEE